MAYLDQFLDAPALRWQSPFNSPAELCASYQYHKGGRWIVDETYIGGLGDRVTLVEKDTCAIIVLWQDSLGGWWIERQNALGGLVVDVEATREIAYLKS